MSATVTSAESSVIGQMQVIAMNGFGSIDTFQLETRPVPEPQHDEVRIRIKVTGFNPVDWKIRRNWYGGDPRQVMGSDCSGIVDAIGSEIDQFSVGDQVCAMTFRSSNGSYAQYACVPHQLVARKPQSFSFEEAATIPLAATTAYRATLANSAFKKGDIIFVAGAGGGVGSYAIQMLKAVGVEKIYTIARDEESAQFLAEKIGIERRNIVLYQGKTPDELYKILLDMNQGRLFDATLDLVGGEMKRLCLNLTGNSGHFSTIVPETHFEYPFWEEDSIPRSRNLSVHQVAIAAELKGSPAERGIYVRQLSTVMELIHKGSIRPPIVNNMGSLSAKTVKEAHTMLESGHVKGKLVMIVEP